MKTSPLRQRPRGSVSPIQEAKKMEKVEIKSGEYIFTGKLLTEEAPETCRVFKEMLPLRSRFIHVRWSGDGIGL